MIYKDRVILITEEYEEGEFGEPIYKGEKETVLPAQRSPLSDKQQLGYFGTYNKKAFKLHLQGKHEGITRIKYEGKPYDVTDVNHHKSSTVLIIS